MKDASGFACLALGLLLIGCSGNGNGLKHTGAAGQACTSVVDCDPGLSCRALDHTCVAPPPDAAPPLGVDANAIGGAGQPCTTGGGCDPGLFCRASDHLCLAPLPDATPPISVEASAIGGAGQPCTTGGGCDPGLFCRATDHICLAPLPDAATAPDAATPPDTAPPVSKCSTSPLGGMSVPAGTMATANASYATSFTPELAIDGIMSTGWNSGGFSGWLRLQFPKPTAISALHIHASASPSTNASYTITGDSLVTIGSVTRQVTAGTTGSMLAPIPVIPGTYSTITIAINGGASWVQIYELTLINDECPLP